MEEALGGGSATNRLNQTARIGFESEFKWKSHLIYSTTSPTQIEIPEVYNWICPGSGDYDYSYSTAESGIYNKFADYNSTATEFNEILFWEFIQYSFWRCHL